ncbi:cytochrome c [Methanolobus mangrovi]|uniref:Cytochrome c n=1 Tax=Methanolobus mangrovi TaxID=3072977 RepID=A0AA51UHT7_9EURY|nr:cytochrome c [Methanolobus mangrovi]WMW23139.1 cytochrome c [Methanolobus mangrovi]
MTKATFIIFFLVGISLVVSGCVNHMNDNYNMPGQTYGWHEPGYMYPEQYDPSVSSNIITEFSSNGEMIYYTGFNESGQQISIRDGMPWLYVHGGSCVSCHGVDGKGGVPIMMSNVIPPDITYEALTSEDEHEEHPPYTDKTIKVAIREGKDPSGEELDNSMPRWDMSNEDVDDLIEYLKTL